VVEQLCELLLHSRQVALFCRKEKIVTTVSTKAGLTLNGKYKHDISIYSIRFCNMMPDKQLVIIILKKDLNNSQAVARTGFEILTL
jgi:hypothetical protein